jgi:hypothetical protein
MLLADLVSDGPGKGTAVEERLKHVACSPMHFNGLLQQLQLVEPHVYALLRSIDDLFF